MRSRSSTVLAFLLLASACHAAGPGGDAKGGDAANSAASPDSAAPGGDAASGASGAAGNGISQADADSLCAELNKGGNTASCQFKDGQIVIRPK